MIPVNQIEIGAKVKYISGGDEYTGHIVALSGESAYHNYKKGLPCSLVITLENFPPGHNGPLRGCYHTDGREGTQEDIYSKQITKNSCWFVESSDTRLYLESRDLPEKQFIENVQLRLKPEYGGKIVKILKYLGFSDPLNGYLVEADDGIYYTESNFEAYELTRTSSIFETSINISPKNQSVIKEKEAYIMHTTDNVISGTPKLSKDFEF